MKKLLLISILILSFIMAPAVHAYGTEAGAAAKFSLVSEALPDGRVALLKSFLESYDSPMANDAAAFVSEADKAGIDYRLLVAIAGVESTFGKFIPHGSYNGWGWGIPTGSQSGLAFTSWGDAIHTISQGLRTNYINKGAVTIEQMGTMYAASPAWAFKVRYFLDKIDTFQKRSPNQIAISL